MDEQTIPVTPEDLKGFRGGPFPKELIRIAVKAIQAECEWVIGPQITETVKVHTRGRSLRLPTLHLVAVDEIRDADEPDAPALDSKLRVEPEGRVTVLRGPSLPEYAEVTFTHGHQHWPEELNLLIASRVRDLKSGRVRSESLASRSIQLDAGVETRLAAPVLDKYRLPPGVSV